MPFFKYKFFLIIFRMLGRTTSAHCCSLEKKLNFGIKPIASTKEPSLLNIAFPPPPPPLHNNALNLLKPTITRGHVKTLENYNLNTVQSSLNCLKESSAIKPTKKKDSKNLSRILLSTKQSFNTKPVPKPRQFFQREYTTKTLPSR